MGASSRATSLVAKAEKIDTIDPETGVITTFERSRYGAFWSVKSAMVFDAVFAIIFDAKKGCFAMVFFHLILMAINRGINSTEGMGLKGFEALLLLDLVLLNM